MNKKFETYNKQMKAAKRAGNKIHIDKAKDKAKFVAKEETTEMLGNVSAAFVPYLPVELHLCCDSDNLTGATLASSSLMFGGGGSTQAASPHVIRASPSQPVASSSCGHALVLPARFCDVALFDQPRSASVGACGKLKHSVSCSLVTSMDSMLPPKEELAELPAAQNRRYSNVEGFGVGDIVWAKCQKDLSVWAMVVVERKQEASPEVICVMLFGWSRQRNEREYACIKILYQEIDYLNEGKNADRFRRDFRNVKWIRIPLVLWDFTSTKVLTLEYVPGIKINNLDQIDAWGYSRSRIATYAIESHLMQVLNSGFFHADPHPGNLAIDIDGSLIYYDFGMMGEIKSNTRDKLLELFYAVYEKDTNKVIRCLVNLEALRPTGDMSPVRRSIQFFLDNLLTSTLDKQQTFAAIGEDLFAIATDQTFHLPSTFAFVLRAFSTLEGIGHELDPNFSVVKLAAPYAQGILDERQRQNGGTVEEIRKQVDDAGNSAISMPYRVRQIEKFFKQLESGDLKLRVRVLESERAARKATILQMATIYTTLGGTLLNVGVTLSSHGKQAIANGCFSITGVFLILLIISMRKVSGLETIEKILK